jgi:hypothetical protein
MYVSKANDMRPTDQTKDYVISNYVGPARQRGEKTVEVKVGTVQRELGWTNRTPSVFSTLSSKEFQEEAGVELIEKRGGPPSGGPSTTWQFVYRILDGVRPSSKTARATPSSGSGLLALYGLCADMYREIGGGEAYLKAERDWGPDPWEKLDAEKANMRRGGDGK